MAEAGREQAERLTGGCLCGALRYRLDGPATGCSLCHCRMCQKAGGGPFLALVAARNLTWTRGAPAGFRSSSRAARGFCRDCGTPLTFACRPDRIEVTLGSLDAPGALRPTSRLGRETVLPWCERVGDLPAAARPGSTVDSTHHPDHA